MQDRLDALEEVATSAILRTYGTFAFEDERARLWIQKGIEGMRYAVALETYSGVYADIGAERTRQDAKWGEQNHDSFTWLAVATEELGEAAQEALTEQFGDTAKGHGDLREELVQCAAVLVAWIECIDRSNES